MAVGASMVSQPSKRARHSGGREIAQPALRRCGNCGGVGHYRQTCQNDLEVSSESNSSVNFIGSIFDSDESEDS